MKKIDVSTKKHPNVFALVDDDAPREAFLFKWHVDGDGYIRRSSSKIFGGQKFLHHVVIGKKDGSVVDHIDGDKLNNQKSNLRFCSKSQNSMNQVGKHRPSGLKGVTYSNSGGKMVWMARICVDYKSIYIGRYETEKEAAMAYDKAAIKYHKEFARLNFPDQLHPSLGDMIIRDFARRMK